jgi:Tub family
VVSAQIVNIITGS